MRLVLWDIDGTLGTARPHSQSIFVDAIRELTGTEPVHEKVTFGGRLDRHLVTELLQTPDTPVTHSEELVDNALARIIELYGERIDLVRKDAKRFPGVPDVQKQLHEKAGLTQGTLTGNMRATALIKLELFGVLEYINLEVSAFGDEADERHALGPIVYERARAVLGEISPRDIWIVGDTAHDFAVAEKLGARSMLVATSRASLEELRALGPDIAVPDLSDVDMVVDLLAN